MAINGELVPAKVEYEDENKWTDQESATSTRMRKTWVIQPTMAYIRVQSYNGLTKIFPPKIDNNSDVPVEIQSVVGKDPGGNFPSIFYYNNMIRN